MTLCERIQASINHREPDRVPIDLGATPSAGISVIAYNRLKSPIGKNNGFNCVYDVVQQLAQPEDNILDPFGADVQDIGRFFNDREEDWYDVSLADDSKAQYSSWFHPFHRQDGSFEVEQDGQVIARMPAGGTFFDQTYFPYLKGYPDRYDTLDNTRQKVLWAASPHSPRDHAQENDFWQQLRVKAQLLGQSSDRALMIVCGCNLFEWGRFRTLKLMFIERLEMFSPGGGFVFNPIHNILPDVPPENIAAMFEALEQFFGLKIPAKGRAWQSIEPIKNSKDKTWRSTGLI